MRKASQERKTRETAVEVDLHLDGTGQTDIVTGVPFLDHMLELFGFHGRFDLRINATGDLEVDDHHTVEDVGIVLGSVLRECLESDPGIERYGASLLPMDEVLARVVVDASGRAYLQYHLDLQRERIGTLSMENVREFFSALVRESRITLHIDILESGNDHHQVEAVFKGFGRALKQAVAQVPEVGVASTKGTL